MKKHLFFAVLVVSLLGTFANARFYLGIDGGYSMDRMDSQLKVNADGSTNNTIEKNAYKGNGYLFNLHLGTEHHFGEKGYVGLRWFLGGGYGKTTLIDQRAKDVKFPSTITEGKLGLDLLLDVIKFNERNSLGLFGGIEGGFNTLWSSSQRTADGKDQVLGSFALIASGRAGITAFLGNHHRIELIAKIPFSSLALSFASKGDNGELLFYKPIQLMVGYKFVF